MAALPEPIKSLSQRIYKLEEQLRRQGNAASNKFAGTGLTCPAWGQLDSVSYVPGVSGFSLNGEMGDLEVNDITLRGGIIGNDALTSPVAPGAIFDYGQGFALTTTLTNIKTTTITVPPGFTKAAVSITVRVYAINPRTSGGYDGLGGDYLIGQANIAGFNGFALPLAVSGNGGSGTNISPFSTVLSGLTPGGSFTVQIAASTSFANWTANGSNTAEVSGAVTWFRS